MLSLSQHESGWSRTGCSFPASLAMQALVSITWMLYAVLRNRLKGQVSSVEVVIKHGLKGRQNENKRPSAGSTAN